MRAFQITTHRLDTTDASEDMDGKADFGEDWSTKCGGVWVSQITRTILNSKGGEWVINSIIIVGAEAGSLTDDLSE